MFFKKKKGLEIKNKGIITHLVLNGVDISKNVTAFKIAQEGGERPEITITISEKVVSAIVNDLKNAEVKVKVRK